jgi:hypothetical protein
MEHAAQSAVATSHVQNLRIQAILQGVEHIPRSPWQIHGNLREICEISMKIYGKPMGDLGEIYGIERKSMDIYGKAAGNLMEHLQDLMDI